LPFSQIFPHFSVGAAWKNGFAEVSADFVTAHDGSTAFTREEIGASMEYGSSHLSF
jgi:hypothetical protein